jgi:chorismate lyase
LGLTKGADNSDEIFVRDVLLKLDGETVIQARSACRPDSRLWTELLDCGTQPLGERLFDGTLPLKRSDFEFLRFEDFDHPSFRRPVTARRSYFDWNGKTLELTEYFLLKLMDLYR